MVDQNGDTLIGLSQPVSIGTIAVEYSVQDSNPKDTPMHANAKLFHCLIAFGCGQHARQLLG